MNEVEKPKRMYFIDNLRILLTILVIMHHTMIVYGAPGAGLLVKDPHTDEFTSLLLSIVALFNQSFFMGLFFFISTYFVPGSYSRKGPQKFLK
ncbi:MAG: acyltransferase family protein, partial [Candidatus Hodarchaeota archaeon]